MTKQLTKKQKKEMLFNATMIAEGAMEPTPTMSYVQAWQHLVNTGEVWKLQGWFGRAAFRMISQGTNHWCVESEPYYIQKFEDFGTVTF
mgnify:CR=1 FL=1